MLIRSSTAPPWTHSLAVAALFILVLGRPVAAQNTVSNSRWRFGVSPYLLVPHMSGATGIGDLTAQVDVGPDDILSRLQ